MLRFFFDVQLQRGGRTDRVCNALLRLVLDSGYSSTITVMILSVALVLMVRPVVALPVRQTWLAGMALLFVGKMLAIFWYQRRKQEHDPLTLSAVQAYVLMLLLTGAMWGLAVILFFKDNAPQEQMAVIFIVAGLTAGAIAVLSPLHRLYYVYVACPLLPLAYRLMQQTGQSYTIMASVIVLYAMMITKTAARIQQSLQTSFEMGFANEQLVDSLRQARNESDALNRELVSENERRKQTEKELVAARDAAESASRAKDEFLANMSHEIRTPMNGILGTLQLLQEAEMEAGQKEYVRIAHGSAESLLGILNDILDFSKIEARKLLLESVPFSLRKIVSELLALVAKQAREKNIELVAEIDPQLPEMLKGDPTRMRQVLLNLLTNAIKFTDQGKVTIRIACLSSSDTKVALRIEVIDTGIGIAPEQQGGLFSSFTQADGSTTRQYGGTGLGLAIVRQLVLLMGGDLGVESVEGRGATFWCTLDLPTAVPAKASEGDQETVPAAQERSLSGRVLLVEDHKVNQLVAMKMLKGFGLTVDLADNGDKALAVLAQEDFDLVLMDCQMPVLDGYAATRKLREREEAEGLPHTIVIAMTANTMAGDRQKCLEAGMDDYLPKPVKQDKLREIVGRWLAAESGQPLAS